MAFPEELSDAWRRLARDLLSPAYRRTMSRFLGRDLTTAPMEAYVCHFGPGAWLGPHVDLKEKIMTHVFYFNAAWDPKDGGCLNILRSSDMADSIAEITPIIGNSSVLVRAQNSWHSVSRVVDGMPHVTPQHERDLLSSRRRQHDVAARRQHAAAPLRAAERLIRLVHDARPVNVLANAQARRSGCV